MFKRTITIIVSIVLCMFFMLNCTAENTSFAQDNECDFDLSTVLIVIKKEYSEFGKEYSPAEFDADLVESVEVINQIEKDQTDLSGYNLEYWQHILLLKLKEPSKKNIEAVINAAYQNEQVESAEKNYIFSVDLGTASNGDNINLNEDHLFEFQNENTASPNASTAVGKEPNDTYYEKQYGLRLTRTNRAWEFENGKNSVKVGVLDSGIATHIDVGSNILISKDFTGTGLKDESGHGTHVAGIIGAYTNNFIGVAGCCWNVSITSLKILKPVSEEFTREESDSLVGYLAEAINYASKKSIRVLNASIDLGENLDFKTSNVNSLRTAIKAYNGLIICAAGNDYNTNGVDYPARFGYDNIISVGAIDSNGNYSSYSNWDMTFVDLAAPGDGIYSTVPDGKYDYKDGTSMATPFVTGAAALVWSVNPDLTAKQVKDIILKNVTRVQNLTDRVSTGGRLNTLKAVLAAKGFQLGDVNMDKQVTAEDARLAERCAAKLETFNRQQLVMADVNYDSEITSADARTILRLSSKLIDPIEL